MNKDLLKTDYRDLLQTARWTLKITRETSPRILLVLTLVTILVSVVPAGLAVAVRGLVNAVADALADPSVGTRLMLIWLAVGLLFTLLETVGNYAVDYLNQRLFDELNIRITGDILEHAADLDVSQFEDPEFQDIIERARQGAASRFATFVNNGLRSITHILQMVSLTVILMLIEPWVIVVLGIVAVPYLLFQWQLSEARYKMGFHRSTNHRWTYYFVSQLTNNQSVPEVKLLGIAPFLIRQFRKIMVDFRDENKQLYGRIFTGSSLFAGISTIAFYATFVRVVLRVVQGNITIGDVAVYGGAMARLRFSLEQAITAIAAVLENALHIANLRLFLETQPALLHGGSVTEGHGPVGALDLQNVSFGYAGTDKQVLHDINFRIEPGETVAIVGRNGAGKTTLVKLLARLYAPDSGQIHFEGVEVSDWQTRALHKRIGFVFQKFGRYEASFANNIAFGNWDVLENNREAVEAIAKQASVDELSEKMPNGYDTMLGRMFGEHNLSGGQWQRVAIARAFARNASLLILDEPTSNMDAKAEYRIFSRFRELARGCTTILISHRFSTVRIADRILVLENGRIIENGSHEQLIALGGTYAQLYDLHTRQMNQAEAMK